MTETLQKRMTTLGEAAHQVHKKLWEGTTTNPLKDTKQYLLLEKENLSLHLTISDLLPEEIEQYQSQLSKVNELLATKNPLPGMVEWVLASLPRKKDTNEVSDIFKSVEARFLSYLD